MKLKGRFFFLFFGIGWLVFCSACMQFRKTTVKAQHEFSEHGMKLNGIRLQHETRDINAVWIGDTTKPWLCFLHGSPGSWTAFENYLQDSQLQARFCMLSFDRPGFGYSDFGQPEPSLEKQAQAFIRVMDSLASGREFYLVGHSLGGPLAVRLAADFPDRVKGIVVLAGSVSPELEPREWFRPVLKKKVFKYLIPRSFWVSNYEIEALMNELVILETAWSRLKSPVLSIHGMDDDFVPVENADYMKKKLENVVTFRDIRLKDKNHFIPWNSMDTIRAEIIKFASDGK